MSARSGSFEGTPVAILCGGLGILLEDGGGQKVNKALVPIHGRPMVWWVMLHYALHGAGEFVLAGGFQQARLREALAAPSGTDRFTIDLAGRSCGVRIVDTGIRSGTGGRLLQCKPWLEHAPRFALTYSDTLSDVDLGAQQRFHQQAGRAATLVAAQYPLRFRVLGMRQNEHLVRRFAARPVIESAPVNGGFYLFEQALWSDRYLGPGADPAALVLEEAVLERLAADEQLAAFTHRGGWQHLDCERDLQGLEAMARSLEAAAHA
jgi:glucose-1-phosphate cytidylyltransferase